MKESLSKSLTLKLGIPVPFFVMLGIGISFYILVVVWTLPKLAIFILFFGKENILLDLLYLHLSIIKEYCKKLIIKISA